LVYSTNTSSRSRLPPARTAPSPAGTAHSSVTSTSALTPPGPPGQRTTPAGATPLNYQQPDTIRSTQPRRAAPATAVQTGPDGHPSRGGEIPWPCGALGLGRRTGFRRVGDQPVGDGHRVGWVGHLADLVQPVLVALGRAFVLAEVLVPGRDDEPLENPARVAGVLPGAPGSPMSASICWARRPSGTWPARNHS
jgi:hypothetical protein